MISVVISEKGGTERRDRYDHSEITIGRVKGNDIVLPKGNVSKKHARLICRDGRYIVTDLKSTNGTYINHRRITHATLVREGDRIYVGDFVIKVEDPDKPAPAEPPPANRSSPAGSDPRSSRGSLSGGSDVISHFPIENDPDDFAAPKDALLPTGVSTPVAARATHPDSDEVDDSGPMHAYPSGEFAEHETERRSSHEFQRVLEQVLLDVEQRLDLAHDPAAMPTAADAQAAIAAAAQTAFKDDDAAHAANRELVENAANDEICALGPLTSLLNDDSVSRIDVMGRKIRVQRREARLTDRLLDFGTHAGVSRALHRLQQQRELQPLFDDSETPDPADATRTNHPVDRADSTESDSPYIELTVRGGWMLFAMTPPVVVGSPSISLERLDRAATTLDSLVRGGSLSRSMATLLGHCVAARANILVVANRESLSARVVDALAAAVPHGHSAAWLGRRPDTASSNDGTIVLDGQEDNTAIRGVSRLAPDHILIPHLQNAWTKAVIDGIHEGGAGVVMGVGGATLRQALSRMGTSLAMNSEGVDPQTAHQWIGSAFDLGLEVTRLRDGRLRIARLSEIRVDVHGLRLHDIFTFAYDRTAAGGSIEGSFNATGTIPRIVEDLAAHGMMLDPRMFRRHSSG
ncbi:MAG: FHA domain-containing protein [Polyangiaceae bacterium]